MDPGSSVPGSRGHLGWGKSRRPLGAEQNAVPGSPPVTGPVKLTRRGVGACYRRSVASVEVSVSLAPAELGWVRRKAERTGTTVSAVLGEAVRELRRHEEHLALRLQHDVVPSNVRFEAMQRLLEELGTDDITPEDVASVIAEWQREP